MLWLLLLLAACHHEPPAPPLTEPQLSAIESLARNGMREADGDPIGPKSVGEVVVIKGFAHNSPEVAVVWGDARTGCDSVMKWPDQIEGRWVVLRGTLALDPKPAPSAGGEGPRRAAESRVMGCEYSVGPEESDVPASSWAWLTELGIAGPNPRLGQAVVVQGQLLETRGMVILRNERGGISLYCDGVREILGDRREILASVEGTLSYLPPFDPPGFEPRLLVASRMPRGGWFLIEECTIREIGSENAE